jgi:hypothetical protein
MNGARAVRYFLTAVLGSALVVLGSRLGAQISPGALARPHRALEGATQCVKCHGLRREPMNRLCLDCHKEVAWLIEQARGLHTAANVRSRTCASCHPDHAGAAFALIEWSEGSAERFDHKRAGWALEGAHATEQCESCHATKYRTATSATLSPRKATAGWLGLETTCASCHRDDDVHRQSLGTLCGNCHTAAKWDDASKFDHDASRYPLTGKHVEVGCDECHLSPRLPITPDADGKRHALFRPLPFRECSSCHTDVHGGKLGPRCASCHVTERFSAVDRRDFDHSRTKYPLRGAHASVSCAACHGNGMRKPTPAFDTCASCHADPHRFESGTSAARSGGATPAATPGANAADDWPPAVNTTGDCASCHRVEGFTPSTFTVARHAQTRYALEGKHVVVRCASCHPSAPNAARLKVARLRVPFGACATCHLDAHGGQLAQRPDKGGCERCHSTAGFAPSTFSVKDHATLRVTLDGRHGAIPCAACHGLARAGLPPVPAAAALGKAKVMLQPREVECAACHVDAHAGRYAARGAQTRDAGCVACHSYQHFRPSTMTLEAHASHGFALDGAHRATPCVACHAELGARPATRTLVREPRGVAALPFAALTTRSCGTCHESPHGGQFDHRADQGACEGCHDAQSFTSAPRFDHERQAKFSLKGAHANVPCAQCHRPTTAASGVERVLYRPLDGRCESCHGARPPRSSGGTRERART